MKKLIITALSVGFLMACNKPEDPQPVAKTAIQEEIPKEEGLCANSMLVGKWIRTQMTYKGVVYKYDKNSLSIYYIFTGGCDMFMQQADKEWAYNYKDDIDSFTTLKANSTEFTRKVTYWSSNKATFTSTNGEVWLMEKTN